MNQSPAAAWGLLSVPEGNLPPSEVSLWEEAGGRGRFGPQGCFGSSTTLQF